MTNSDTLVMEKYNSSHNHSQNLKNRKASTITMRINNITTIIIMTWMKNKDKKTLKMITNNNLHLLKIMMDHHHNHLVAEFLYFFISPFYILFYISILYTFLYLHFINC